MKQKHLRICGIRRPWHVLFCLFYLVSVHSCRVGQAAEVGDPRHGDVKFGGMPEQGQEDARSPFRSSGDHLIAPMDNPDRRRLPQLDKVDMDDEIFGYVSSTLTRDDGVPRTLLFDAGFYSHTFPDKWSSVNSDTLSDYFGGWVGLYEVTWSAQGEEYPRKDIDYFGGVKAREWYSDMTAWNEGWMKMTRHTHKSRVADGSDSTELSLGWQGAVRMFPHKPGVFNNSVFVWSDVWATEEAYDDDNPIDYSGNCSLSGYYKVRPMWPEVRLYLSIGGSVPTRLQDSAWGNPKLQIRYYPLRLQVGACWYFIGDLADAPETYVVTLFYYLRPNWFLQIDWSQGIWIVRRDDADVFARSQTTGCGINYRF